MSECQTKAGNQECFEKLGKSWENLLNNFCFHVYAQKSLFIGEDGNAVLQHCPPHLSN